MKKSEIQVGGQYTAKVGGRLTTVRVDAIREMTHPRSSTYTSHRPRKTTHYAVTNLVTGRTTTFRSAAKFRDVAKQIQPTLREEQEAGEAKNGMLDALPRDLPYEVEEDEQRLPPTSATGVASPSPAVVNGVGNGALGCLTNGLASRLAHKVAPARKFPLTDEQLAGIDAALSEPVLVLEAGAGCGKCLGVGTPILMFDGSIMNVEDVEEGDQLMGPDSRPRNVISTSSGQGELCLIVPVKGDPWVCNYDHILTLTGSNHVMRQTIDISVKDYLESINDEVPNSTSWKLMRVPVEFVPQRPLPVDPYLVGIWMGDGIRGGSNIANGWPEIHEYCKGVAAAYNLSCSVVDDPREDMNTSTIRFVSERKRTGDNVLRTFFRSCTVGCLKKIPNAYLVSSTYDRMALLAGIVDTDGYKSSNSTVEVGVTGELYRDDLMFLCRSLGFAAYCTNSKTHVHVNGKISVYFDVSISGDLDRLPVKVHKFGPRRQVKRVLVTGFEVESLGFGNYYGFTLDGDGRFLLGDFTVTHNTSELVEIANALGGRGQYTAFNTSLVAESKTKMPSHCGCNTIHSLAFRSEGSKFAHRLPGKSGSRRMRASEVAAILGIQPMTVLKADGKSGSLDGGFLASVASKAVKAFCQSADREVTLDHFGPVTGLVEDQSALVQQAMLSYARLMWEDAQSVTGRLPFAHDHYVKMWQLNNPIISADYVLLDEAQDTSPVMLSVMEQQVARGVKVILVGDSAQQIYSWRGAVNALAAFPQAKRLYLSQSFRFGPVVAEVANAVLACLQHKSGLKMRGFDKIPSRLASVAAPAAILCRTNAAAVQAVLTAIGEKKRPHLIGGWSDVLAFVEAAQDLQAGRRTQHPELSIFESWGEVQVYSKTDEGEDLKLMVKLIDTFKADKIASALRNMPEEKSADLVVCTAHKSKGREWQSVKLAGDFLPMSKMGEEEIRLLYVAATRAQGVLDLESCPPFCASEREVGDEGRIVRDRAIDLSTARELSRKVSEGSVTETKLEEVKQQAFEKAGGTGDVNAVRPHPSPYPPDNNTWSKDKDGRWRVRGKPGQSGRVEVVRRDGSRSTETLGKVIYQDALFAVYEVVEKGDRR